MKAVAYSFFVKVDDCWTKADYSNDINKKSHFG